MSATKDLLSAFRCRNGFGLLVWTVLLSEAFDWSLVVVLRTLNLSVPPIKVGLAAYEIYQLITLNLSASHVLSGIVGNL